ncbi:bifunctional molybdenum cofactor guanylyltransferase MobA/molybdopterin-guanine dinucleotide biosynthesis adaptor protein MobB [Vespertiliibacter pulmonis]|uniref:Molybdenum cofactor guanylyltransferase n=1 Tax=Vespertiliibacter pulmonis TaxID=1443036 RepID=A0A3N4VLV9_9PAST|nr:molybdenum cofactor guanylyltransferase MobA [Vespertiliibacter pulmonis]QLB20989.1 bifunctional molybdenum cofactor guanylyltransferase MobA/molybdopterin-guanine dinucleotide biosynthesis adaptor protein MobB [Vespertiliibacter pulmonis]RPE80759.1 molybdopterin-guanine dinucleotide biosynthesis protein [Vespertiliibacter pulmonis]
MSVSAVILSGGLARRFGGKEKGLQQLNGKPIISHILDRLTLQVSDIYLNINRSEALYQQLYPEIPKYSDNLEGFQGALSGMLSGFQRIESEYLLFVPCDCPFPPKNLLQKLSTSLRINQVNIAYAHDGEQAHPTFALLHRTVEADLMAYLAQGERRLLHFFQTQRSVAVDFSEQSQAFQNFNTEEALASGQFRSSFCSVPLLAITGHSGTGKTTLLEKIIPQLLQKGVRVGVIKHSHHNVEVDKEGKDSHRLRLSGANPTMIVCDQRWALMNETQTPAEFAELVAKFDNNEVDLVLVEGFKQETLPKIQLHRQALANQGKPLPELDSFTIATATDYSLERENHLNINDIEQISEFICKFLVKQTACN